MAFQLFISYSTKDLSMVQQLQHVLTDPDIRFFIAEYSVRGGESLNKKILPAIQNANLFVLLWSKHSQESEWVAKEVEQALAFDIPIYPVLLDDEAQLPAVLGDLKYVAAQQDLRQALTTIQAQVFERAAQKRNKELALLIGAGVFLWAASR